MPLPVRLVVILAIASIAAGCAHNAATCFQPSVRPTGSLTPDLFGSASTPGNAWLEGSSERPPRVLHLSDGVIVNVDSHTRRVSACGGAICSVYIGYRAHTHIADWIFGVIQGPGSKSTIDQAAVWDIGNGVVVLSTGLRLNFAPTISPPSRSELLTWGTLVSLTLNNHGVIQAINHPAGGCA